LLFNHLVLGLGVHCSLVEENVLALLVLDLNHSLLLYFLLLTQVDGLLYFLSFDLPLPAHMVDLLLVILLHHLVDPQGLHLLLYLHLILLLERDDLSRALLRLLNLLPRAHLLLLQQGYAICQQLGVTLDTLTVKLL